MNEQPRQRRDRRDVKGIFLLDKPEGLSSNAALQKVKRAFSALKAGHTGSLDVLATGLLPICFGEATKISAFLLEADKSYHAEIHLGIVTKTGDREGEVTRTESNVRIDPAIARRTLEAFVGEIRQIPPMHSALKRNGQRLYKLAHKGLEIEREPRTVTIYKLTMVSLERDRLFVEVDCSKGTYIRTLAEDIGAALGCGAHLASLRRTRSGPFSLADACSMDEVMTIGEHTDAFAGLDAMLLPLDSALSSLPDLHLSDESVHSISCGQSVCVPSAPGEGLVRLYRLGSEFVGVGAILADGRVTLRRLIR